VDINDAYVNNFTKSLKYYIDTRLLNFRKLQGFECD